MRLHLLTALLPEGRGFPLHRARPMVLYSNTGLMASPWADTASPAAKILRAALTSRSCCVPHCGHVQARTDSGIEPWVWPHVEHRLLDGYQRSMPISVRPAHCALYSNCLTSSDQLASLIDLARLRLRSMFFTASVSRAITWFSLINRVESLCRKSLRASVMCACKRATFNFSLARFFEPSLAHAPRRAADAPSALRSCETSWARRSSPHWRGSQNG